MTNVLQAHNTAGFARRCNATCYNAKTPTCNCICGGRNHGVGLQQAVANNLGRIDYLADEIIKAFPHTEMVELVTKLPTPAHKQKFLF